VQCVVVVSEFDSFNFKLVDCINLRVANVYPWEMAVLCI